MTDVEHELGAIRFVVDAPLSSKVAMFNNVANQHKESQLLNPFSHADFRQSPKRSFNKDEYGRPLAGSLTEMRGAKANIHVCKEMLQLCQIIDTEGFPVSEEEPDLKVIRFGDLFNIYTLISDKVVGLLLRARKYKLVHFEGEVLFQRRDDDVPIFMLKPFVEIKRILEEKQDEVRRSVSPAPQPTTVLLDNLRRSVSPSPTVGTISRSVSPAPLRENLSRDTSPVPQQNDANRSGTPVPEQKDVARSASPPTQENNLTQIVSPSRQQSNNDCSTSPEPKQSNDNSASLALQQNNNDGDVSRSSPTPKLDSSTSSGQVYSKPDDISVPQDENLHQSVSPSQKQDNVNDADSSTSDSQNHQ